MDQPLVSILTPVYKSEPYIKRCADSLFSQTYPNIEFIFVDDATPDNSITLIRQVLENYPHRMGQVRFIHHNRNKGIAEARNTCLREATGIYILFIDSDDWIEPNTVEKLTQVATATNSDIVGFDCILEKKEQQVYKKQNYPATRAERINGLIRGDFFNSLWMLFVKHELYQKHSISFPAVNFDEDFVVIVQLFYYACSFSYCEKAFYHYNQQNEYSACNNRTESSLIQTFEGIRYVEQFLISRNCIQDFDLNHRKFWKKNRLIQDKNLRNYPLWKQTFPESNQVWRNYSRQMSTSQKIIYWLAEHNWAYILYFLWWLQKKI